MLTYVVADTRYALFPLQRDPTKKTDWSGPGRFKDQYASHIEKICHDNTIKALYMESLEVVKPGHYVLFEVSECVFSIVLCFGPDIPPFLAGATTKLRAYREILPRLNHPTIQSKLPKKEKRKEYSRVCYTSTLSSLSQASFIPL
jgi:hypothetical protein